MKNFKHGLRAGAAVLTIAVAVGWTASPLYSSARAADPAASLTSTQIASIDAAVQTALQNIPPGLSGQALLSAQQAAIATATQTEIGIYGSAAAEVVTTAAVSDGVPVAQAVAGTIQGGLNAGVGGSTIVEEAVLGGSTGTTGNPTVAAEAALAAAESDGIDAGQAGSGLGAAAAQLSTTNAAAAQSVASVVANEGSSGTQSAFSTSVVANGGSQQLAQAGGAQPTVTGQTSTPGAGQQQGSNPGTTLPPCANPSCT